MKPDIRAIILDVDGVIVGEKIGFNSPHPHPTIISALKQIQNRGIPICLCTAKPHFAISQEIKAADLNNLHITDGGGVVINPVDDVIVKQNNIDSNKAIQVLQAFLDHEIYVEFYTVNHYFIQKSQAGEITQKHAHVLQVMPQEVKSLTVAAKNQRITKIMPIAINEADKTNVEKIFDKFKKDLVLSWGVHPVILPLQFGIITAPGISKKQGVIEIARALKIPLENILGVGDSASDWQFIEICGFGVAMGNGHLELKNKVMTKGIDRAFIAPSVDENGILAAFKHFGLD